MRANAYAASVHSIRLLATTVTVTTVVFQNHDERRVAQDIEVVPDPRDPRPQDRREVQRLLLGLERGRDHPHERQEHHDGERREEQVPRHAEPARRRSTIPTSPGASGVGRASSTASPSRSRAVMDDRGPARTG